MARHPVRSSLVAVVAASALILAACGDDDDTTVSGAAPSTAGATTAAPTTAAPTTLGADDAYGGGYALPTTVAATPTTVAGAPAGATVALAELEGEDALVNSEGFSVYLFTDDAEGVSNCSGACAEAWPPVVVEGEPVAGEGLDAAKLGTITRDDGAVQATYNGHPLYLFAADTAAGQTNGQGSGGVWFLVDAAGEAIE